MKSFLKTKSVGSGMAHLLDFFCEKNHLRSPVKHIYHIDDRIPLNRWFKKLKYVDQQYKQDGLGLDIASLSNASYIGISAYLATSCKNLSSYIGMPIQYISIWYDYMYKEVYFSDDEIIISWGKPAYYRANIFVRETAISEELQVGIIFQRVKQITGENTNVFNRVTLAIPKPKNTRKYEEYFGCPVIFDAELTSFHICKHVIEMPLSSEDPVLFELLKKQAEEMMKKMPKNSTFLENVNQAIIKSINLQDPKIGTVAEYLNLSSRSLQSMLKEQGVTFQDLLNNVRLNLAQEYLSQSDKSIIEISNLLGYQEQTSFNRGFKTWTGHSPMRWRDLHNQK
ncbi:MULTISPECIES: helix-turn-helix domain-containing protein [Acinetobacter]|uniref:AraC family transcriptional regulator n=1 Tax=Acinetobacter chengduensis TaxID=2420890 RepID=A0ABX9TXL8_9GAMM|nr:MULTISPECIES: AraC family transcriptional regulator [Acinetobacter]MBI1452366.1 helix-turn-helix domain-containing protein [Acinetobacter sp. FL51]RLL23033.1 AraC family transcriptional regulator [Acinetobacter chengduensis]